MLTRTLLTVAILGATACTTDNVSDPNPPDLPADTRNSQQIAFAVGAPEATPDPEMCAEDGPCCAACDGALILELFVPPGTCATFVCSGDGEDRLVGGCHP